MEQNADEPEDSDKTQQELTSKYLSGEISFLEYAQLLAEDDDSEEENEVDDDLVLPVADSAVAGAGQASTAVEVADSDKNLPQPKPARRGRNSRRNRALPPTYQGLLGEANLTFARGNAEAAEKMCMEVIRQCPSASEPFMTLAMLYEERGDSNKSFQCRLIASYLGSSELGELLRLADECKDRELYREAMECYTRALRLSPTDLKLHYKRLECCRSSGDTSVRSAARILQFALRRMIDSPDASFSLLKQLNEILLPKESYSSAIRCASFVFRRHGHLASWEDSHQYIELLLNVEQYTECVQFLLRHCSVTVTPPLDPSLPDAELRAALTDIRQVTVPDTVPADVKYKLLVALVRLDSVAGADSLLAELLLCDAEVYGDLYLDVSEALMARKRHVTAITVLQKLTDTVSYAKAGPWLLLAECFCNLDRIEEATAAYRKVIALAPHHSEARINLSNILKQQGHLSEAIEVLSRDCNAENVIQDTTLLLEKCDLLRRDGCPDELIDTVQTLLTQHCPVVRTREDARCMLCLPKSRENQIPELRCGELSSANLENTGLLFVDRPAELEKQWDLLLTVLKEMERRGDDQTGFFLLMRARGSREFLSNSGINSKLDSMIAIASFKVGDFELGFPMVRKLLLADPSRLSYWNLLNLIAMQAEDIRHARFLMRLTHRVPDVVALCLMNGHNCLMSGTYKYALVEYLTAYKLDGRIPMIPLLIAITFVHQVSQKFTIEKHPLLAQACAFLSLYMRLRGPCQESYYNLGRAMHQVGLTSEALHYYKKALACRPADGGGILDMRGEIGYNLALIYRQSGNHRMASHIMQKYCVI